MEIGSFFPLLLSNKIVGWEESADTSRSPLEDKHLRQGCYSENEFTHYILCMWWVKGQLTEEGGQGV